jgi:hypothetical protein
MKILFNIFIVLLLTIILTGCERFYDKENYEDGALTLWSGGKVMAKFPQMTIVYSVADSDALYFTDIKGSNITLRTSEGDLVLVEGKGETWYTSPGVLINLGK